MTIKVDKQTATTETEIAVLIVAVAELLKRLPTQEAQEIKELLQARMAGLTGAGPSQDFIRTIMEGTIEQLFIT